MAFELDADRCAELGVAINEASLLGVEVDAEQRAAGVTLSVLTLPPSGPAPADPRVQFVFQPVGRVIASLRNGAWNEADAEIVPFEIDEMPRVVRSFGAQPVYGWDFFDVGGDDESGDESGGGENGVALRRDAWMQQLSLDWGDQNDGMAHHLTLFQEGDGQHLDLRLYFDRFVICDPYGNQLDFGEFCRGGKRWWEALHAGDPRAQGQGIETIREDYPDE